MANSWCRLLLGLCLLSSFCASSSSIPSDQRHGIHDGIGRWKRIVPEDVSGTAPPVPASPAPPASERSMRLVRTQFLDETTFSLRRFRRLDHMHSAIQLEGGSEPILRFQVVSIDPARLQRVGFAVPHDPAANPYLPPEAQGLVKSVLAVIATEMAPDWPVIDRAKPPRNSQRVAKFYDDLPPVRVSNAKLFDPVTGNGILLDVLRRDTVYRSGRDLQGKVRSINDCNTFSGNVLKELGVQPGPRVQRIFDDNAEFALRDRTSQTASIRYAFYSSLPGKHPVTGETTTARTIRGFDFQDNLVGEAGKATPMTGLAPPTPDTAAPPPPPDNLPSDVSSTADDLSLTEVDPASAGALDEGAATTPATTPESGEETSPLCKRGGLCDKAGGGALDIVSGRTGGALQTLRVAGAAAVEVAGVAATVAAAVIVIIDFVNHNWVGAGIGLAGLVAGLAVGLAVEGPVGWVLAGVVTIFFAILPGAFEHRASPAPATDKTKIIQYMFFGDAGHTGHEKCEQDHPGANCTATYGPGILASAFEWDNFDAVAFLAYFNDGYAMSIADMANAFTLIDSKKSPSNGSEPATMDCQNGPHNSGRFSIVVGDDPRLCNHPKVSIRREAMMLPRLNQTAAQVYGRIEPNANADCVLVNDAAAVQEYADYNITFHGGQAAFACGIQPGFNVNGTVLPVQGDAGLGQAGAAGNASASVVSSGQNSTDGEAGHHVDPPPATAFDNSVINATNSVCFGGGGNPAPVCLPNGTYTPQLGGFGFSMRGVDSLTLPGGGGDAGSWLAYTIHTMRFDTGRFGYMDRPQSVNRTANVAAGSDKKFLQEMAAMVEGSQVSSFEAHVPSNAALPAGPPACCLYTDTNFRGDVACFGPGGDMLPAQVQNGSKSLRLLGGMNAWMYARSYGDIGGALATSDVADLSSELYGPDHDNFSQRIVALWIFDPAAVVLDPTVDGGNGTSNAAYPTGPSMARRRSGSMAIQKHRRRSA